MTDIEMRDDEEGMSEDDYMHAAWAMERMGGGFAARIAQAYYVADKDNKARLRAAFGELFSKYHNQGESK